MTKHSITVGLCIGIAGVALLCFFAVFTHVRFLQLPQGILFVLSSVGCVSALDFGLTITFLGKSKDFGDLSEYRVVMALGSLAVIWVSIQSMFQIIVLITNSPSPNITPP